VNSPPPALQTMRYTVTDSGVAIVTIDVPERPVNVLTPALHREIGAVAERLAQDERAVGAVIRSGKPAFLAGGDLKRIVGLYDQRRTAVEAFEQSRTFTASLRRLETCGKPVAVCINGTALGGGLELALACHYRVLLDDPRVRLGLPETPLGLLPGGGGTQRLPRLLGIEQAAALILSGRSVDAGEALRLGIVHALAGADELLATAERWILEQGQAVQPWDRRGYQIPGGAGLNSPALGRLFQRLTTQVSAETRHNYPAPIAALRCLFKGTSVSSMDLALTIETREFSALTRDPVARNMIRTQFLFKGEAERSARERVGEPRPNLARAALHGAGDAARPWREAFASAGIEAADDDAPGAGTVELAVLASRDALAAACADARSGDATLVVATTELTIEAVAAAAGDAARVVGLYAAPPLAEARALEIVLRPDTGDTALVRVLELARRLRKTPVRQYDAGRPFGECCLLAFIDEGLRLLCAGVAPALIENAAWRAGLPAGPLALADRWSLDAVRRRLHAGERHAAAILAPLLDAGRTGRVAGAGFYDYTAADAPALWSGLSGIVAPAPAQPPAGEVSDRLVCVQSLAAARCWEAGWIRPADADLASVLGWGFPAFTGGVLSHVDTLGLSGFIARCDALADRCGEHLRPSPWLRTRARAGERIHPPAGGDASDPAPGHG